MVAAAGPLWRERSIIREFCWEKGANFGRRKVFKTEACTGHQDQLKYTFIAIFN
jgi:hypothetical protein